MVGKLVIKKDNGIKLKKNLDEVKLYVFFTGTPVKHLMSIQDIWFILSKSKFLKIDSAKLSMAT